jgi:hypothetical protein
MRTADVLVRLAGAAALAMVTGLAVALLAGLIAESSRHTVDYVTPNLYNTQTSNQLVTGHITDPRR